MLCVWLCLLTELIKQISRNFPSTGSLPLDVCVWERCGGAFLCLLVLPRTVYVCAEVEGECLIWRKGRGAVDLTRFT